MTFDEIVDAIFRAEMRQLRTSANVLETKLASGDNMWPDPLWRDGYEHAIKDLRARADAMEAGS